jgi:hypothetical protein
MTTGSMRALVPFFILGVLGCGGEAESLGSDAGSGAPDASPADRPCAGMERVPLFVVIVKKGASSYAATIMDHGRGLCVSARMVGPADEPGPTVHAALEEAAAFLQRDWAAELDPETSCGVDGEVPTCRTELVVRVDGQDYELPSRDDPGPLGDAYRFVRAAFETGVPLRERDAELLASGDWPLP